MIKKEDYQCWERFVLAVRQGKSAAVQSEERREAILAIAGFVGRYHNGNSIYFVNAAKPNSRILTGNGGISHEMESLGYIGTICAQVEGIVSEPETLVFQDLHLTKEQMEKLKDNIEHFLKTTATQKQ